MRISFYTDNANCLALDCITEIRASLVANKVACGKQSLDMHLISYHGFLIGCEPPEGRQYVVVNNDADFDRV